MRLLFRNGVSQSFHYSVALWCNKKGRRNATIVSSIVVNAIFQCNGKERRFSTIINRDTFETFYETSTSIKMYACKRKPAYCRDTNHRSGIYQPVARCWSKKNVYSHNIAANFSSPWLYTLLEKVLAQRQVKQLLKLRYNHFAKLFVC